MHFYYDEQRQIADRAGGRGLARNVLRRDLLDTLADVKGQSIMVISHVINDYTPPGKDKKRNHRKSYGYLRTPELSQHVAAFLGS